MESEAGSIQGKDVPIRCHEAAPTTATTAPSDSAYSQWLRRHPTRPICTASESSLEMVAEWVEDCLINHPNCSRITTAGLPTRLLDLGPLACDPENGYVRLVLYGSVIPHQKPAVRGPQLFLGVETIVSNSPRAPDLLWRPASASKSYRRPSNMPSTSLGF
ncbi:hypothetical protein BU26DRAFT_503991 [Trematosphaeria pertusa]|uniref:Uncharacterized protein n=1 Tax=Trematosphaeria pertusa TaxID=390896 RepID=A0A6A6IPS1_9PLEO|nr:uncharacterized protein BU26DRAFT_503991 [Trematosphaeria pertusa]KAF2251493.1 hypothetical protein BU26DRAFT_503991 [Trematosphaeria pertusa]